MKILREDCLREILLQSYNKEMTIVSAFISGIEFDIKQLLAQHN
ncbi:hypothetical protein [Snodgrassella gandavensis]|nr:hypothetical protein [Snodgrassella gandavensis]